MKKFTIIFAALFAATFANAQITKVGEVAGHLQIHSYDRLIGNVMYSQIDQEAQVSIKLYNLSGSNIQEYKTINISKVAVSNKFQVEHLSRNYFTTDGKICFLYHEYSGSLPNFVVEKCQVIDEDGNVVYDVTEKPFYEGSEVYNIDGIYYLIIYDFLGSNNTSYIYALPGNGDTSVDVMSPISPRRSATRKLLHNDQVLIENADHTYTMQGQEVK